MISSLIQSSVIPKQKCPSWIPRIWNFLVPVCCLYQVLWSIVGFRPLSKTARRLTVGQLGSLTTWPSDMALWPPGSLTTGQPDNMAVWHGALTTWFSYNQPNCKQTQYAISDVHQAAQGTVVVRVVVVTQAHSQLDNTSTCQSSLEAPEPARLSIMTSKELPRIEYVTIDLKLLHGSVITAATCILRSLNVTVVIRMYLNFTLNYSFRSNGHYVAKRSGITGVCGIPL